MDFFSLVCSPKISTTDLPRIQNHSEVWNFFLGTSISHGGGNVMICLIFSMMGLFCQMLNSLRSLKCFFWTLIENISLTFGTLPPDLLSLLFYQPPEALGFLILNLTRFLTIHFAAKNQWSVIYQWGIGFGKDWNPTQTFQWDLYWDGSSQKKCQKGRSWYRENWRYVQGAKGLAKSRGGKVCEGLMERRGFTESFAYW